MHSNIAFTNSSDPLRIGGHKDNDSFALNGIVDEVMIFDKNLTDEEIQNIYYINLTIEEFVAEITLAEEILGDNNTTKEEYLNKLTSLQKINTAINEESNFGALRYPGGKVTNLFEWKKQIGPIEARKYTIHGDPEQTPEFPYFGVDEAASYAEENNSEFAYVYNMGNGNKYDASDLVEYLNCKEMKKADPNIKIYSCYDTQNLITRMGTITKSHLILLYYA